MASWPLYRFLFCFLSFTMAVVSSPLIQIPPVQRGGARTLDPHIGSLSIESCYITDYFGEPGRKNDLTWNLLSNFAGEFGGLDPYLRLGGHTQDHASLDPNQTEALTNLFANGNDEAINVTYGPTLFKDVLLYNVPQTSTLILGLNFKTLNVSIALDTARAAWDAFRIKGQQSRLRMTIGNEPDQWGWSAEAYEPHMKMFVNAIKSELNLPSNWFQLGDLANPPDPPVTGQNYTNNFLLRKLLQLGLGSTGGMWTLSQHTYPFSACSEQTKVRATLSNLLNYTNIAYHMSMFIPDIAAANAEGYDYVLGETGSVSCHGKQSVSDRFGAALYMINFMLHGASIGIKRGFFHNGTPFFYSLWMPSFSHSAHMQTVNPTYGSLLFVSQVLGAKGSERSIVEIVKLRQIDLSVFAVFDTHTDVKHPPTALVFVDSQVWSPPSRRPTRNIDLNAVTGQSGFEDFSVKRFTSARGVNAASTDFSLAGIRVDNHTGKLVGRMKPEKGRCRGGRVLLNAAEAVLVEFHKTTED